MNIAYLDIFTIMANVTPHVQQRVVPTMVVENTGQVIVKTISKISWTLLFKRARSLCWSRIFMYLSYLFLYNWPHVFIFALRLPKCCVVCHCVPKINLPIVSKLWRSKDSFYRYCSLSGFCWILSLFSTSQRLSHRPKSSLLLLYRSRITITTCIAFCNTFPTSN